MSTVVERTIRDPQFASRLNAACDMHPHAPAKFHGRLTWLQATLGRAGVEVSLETVRRWFAGEVRPRPDKGDRMAEVLGVDVAWLMLGVTSVDTIKQCKARSAMADGAVNIVAGLIQMDGGHPAFPAVGDQRAEQQQIDIYAILRGQSYAFHVSMGVECDRGYSFHVPRQSQGVAVLGVVRRGMMFEIYCLDDDVIESMGRRDNDRLEVTVSRLGDLRRIYSFASEI